MKEITGTLRLEFDRGGFLAITFTNCPTDEDTGDLLHGIFAALAARVLCEMTEPKEFTKVVLSPDPLPDSIE